MYYGGHGVVGFVVEEGDSACTTLQSFTAFKRAFNILTCSTHSHYGTQSPSQGRGYCRVAASLLHTLGLRVEGSGCTVEDLGFRVQGSGSGFKIQGSGFRVLRSGFRVQDSGCRVWLCFRGRAHNRHSEP